MNAQEFINKLEEFKAFYGKESKDDFYKGKREAYSVALNLAREVKILQQPVVKPFVGEWFEEHKDDLEQSLFDLVVRLYTHGKRTEFDEWFSYSKNKPTEILIRMKDGYDVEKEPIYVVKNMNHDLFLSEFSLHDMDGRSCQFIRQRSEALHFTNKKRADAVAEFVNGKVAEVTERISE